MRQMFLVPLLLASSVALAEGSLEDGMTQDALREYAGITAGVRLDRRCHFLAAGKAKAFEANVAKIRSGLAAQLESSEPLDRIDQHMDDAIAAKGSAVCSAEAKAEVEDLAANAEEWATPKSWR